MVGGVGSQFLALPLILCLESSWGQLPSAIAVPLSAQYQFHWAFVLLFRVGYIKCFQVYKWSQQRHEVHVDENFILSPSVNDGVGSMSTGMQIWTEGDCGRLLLAVAVTSSAPIRFCRRY